MLLVRLTHWTRQEVVVILRTKAPPWQCSVPFLALPGFWCPNWALSGRFCLFVLGHHVVTMWCQIHFVPVPAAAISAVGVGVGETEGGCICTVSHMTSPGVPMGAPHYFHFELTEAAVTSERVKREVFYEFWISAAFLFPPRFSHFCC